MGLGMSWVIFASFSVHFVALLLTVCNLRVLLALSLSANVSDDSDDSDETVRPR